MTQDFGLTQTTMTPPNFVGDHPVIHRGATIATSGAVRTVLAGTVLGLVTADSKMTEWVHDAEDGSEDPVAILMEDVVVGAAADEKAAVYVHGEFRNAGLTWDATAEAADLIAAKAALDALGIYIK